MTERGRLIAIEGIDGSGKSTQARLLSEALGAELTREPGATALGRALRQLLLEPSGAAVDGVAEALLMAADRAEHVAEVLRPALDEGRWVVSDRYSASTLAYQGHGRGLALDQLEHVIAWATAGLRADLTVLVDVEPQVALARAVVPADRFEQLGGEFQARVRQGYLALAAADADGWVVVDGSRPVDEVAQAVRHAVDVRLGPAPATRR